MNKTIIKSSIRKKIKISILLLAVLLTVLIHIISTKIILKSYEHIEKDVVLVNVDRMSFAIDYIKKNQMVKIKDWSVWNETYEFLENRNEEYIENNLYVEGLANLDVNFMIFFDKEGELVYSKAINLEKLSEVDSSDLSGFFQIQKDILTHKDGDDIISGLVQTPNGLAVVSSAPVLKNDGSGPIAGSLIFGNFINKESMSELEGFFLAPLDVFEYKNILPNDVVLAKDSFYKLDTNKYIKALSKENIAGYYLEKDLNNNPVAIFKVLVDRSFYNEGKNNFIAFTIISGLLFLLFGFVILYILEKSILSKIIKLNDNILDIKNENNFKNRLDVIGNDEFGQLSLSINEMLDKIYFSQEKEKKLINQEKVAVENLKNHIETTEKLNKLMIKRELKMIELKKEIEKLKKSNI